MRSGKFIFSLPHLAALASFCIYSLSWYLFPPTAEPVMESSGEPEEMPIPHNLYNAEEDMPTDSRVDEIIREIKEENPKSENDGKE